ncbi:Endoribonuclease Dicer, partial [Fragariocoptes setiger]
MSIRSTQTSKLYQADLYDTVMHNSTIVCLGSEKAKTFIFLMSIKARAHEIHRSANPTCPNRHDRSQKLRKCTIVVEPSAGHASDRWRLLSDQTELTIANLFDEPNRAIDEHQIIMTSLDKLNTFLRHDQSFATRINFLIFDHAQIILQEKEACFMIEHIMHIVKPILNANAILVLMPSLISERVERTPNNTMTLIYSLETLFGAKCETLSDLRSFNKQLWEPTLKVIKLETNPSVFYDCHLLVDSMLRDFCNFLMEEKLGLDDEQLKLKTKIDDLDDISFDDESPSTPNLHILDSLLSKEKQILIIQSCLSDLLYSAHCLGLWCTKATIDIYQKEFCRLIQIQGDSYHPKANLICATNSMLDCLRDRTDRFSDHFEDLFELNSDLEPCEMNSEELAERISLIESTSPQLKSLLAILVEYRPETQTAPKTTKHVDNLILKNKPGPNYSRPLCGLIYVTRRVIAKVVALWIHQLSTSKHIKGYEFIKPDYIVSSSRKHKNRLAVDDFDLHHESAIRSFRYGECNLLITPAISEKGTDMPRCNLVVSLNLPKSFPDYVHIKGSSRMESGKYFIMLDEYSDRDCEQRLKGFINSEYLLSTINRKEIALESDLNSELNERLLMMCPKEYCEPCPSASSENAATIWTSIGIINKYCTRLPSDSFTRLSPAWRLRSCHWQGVDQYYCEVRLPINSPIRQTIIGPIVSNKNLALRLAALKVCHILHESHELDDNMMPITKESLKTTHCLSGGSDTTSATSITRPPRLARNPHESHGRSVRRHIGTTKRRQYYRKMVAPPLAAPLPRPQVPCYLYRFTMVLACPIPDEQNRRGRRIVDPAETERNFAIVCSGRLPKICSFPVFTRSGEVVVSLDLVDDQLVMCEQQIVKLKVFHEFTFSKVLRLKRYPTQFDPDSSPCAVLLAPVLDHVVLSSDEHASIDWKFVDIIIDKKECQSYIPSEEERRNFKFKYEDYVDAVVIPWYRTTDRLQFSYYVAEICSDLTPKSEFPDVSSGYSTFEDYYKAKYDIVIYHDNQPVLDVDHTSARLNLLTPRYVNRKGVILPSSNAKTLRESRESLVQKQLLIPELCSIHPFPASFWRKAVCLPCIFYRVNSLFLAEELRRQVAAETRVGFVEPPANFQWDSLYFGWSIKDVIGGTWSSMNEDADDRSDDSQDDPSTCKSNWKSNSDLCKATKPIYNELFLPSAQLSRELDNKMVDNLLALVTTNDCKGLSKFMSQFDFSQNTQLEFGQASNNQLYYSIAAILQKHCPQYPNFSDPDKMAKLLKYWLNTMQKFEDSVNDTISKNPDMFHDNTAGLISIESFSTAVEGATSKARETPNFGELLPDRDIFESSIENHKKHEAQLDGVDSSSSKWKSINFDPKKTEKDSIGPGPSIILHALTMSNASDGINLERLETVGDSFLKYSITAYLYCSYPSMHEGKLSFLRSREISNLNLYNLGRAKNLGTMMLATKFEPNDNWLAPGYVVRPVSTQSTINGHNQSTTFNDEVANANSIDDSSDDSDCSTAGRPLGKRQAIDKALSEVPYDILLQHSIPDKSIADCVEALIGAYLTASGSRAALLFMRWLGLKVIPSSFDLAINDAPDQQHDEMWRWLPMPSSPLIVMPPSVNEIDARVLSETCGLDISIEAAIVAAKQELDRHYYGACLNKFEDSIGYVFKDKSYLVQAFTHNSYYENHVTDCHQRLEFLGDALLDYLITRYLFEDPRCHSPGTLTDLRSALVNNTFFASLAVKYNFHKYLRFVSDELLNVVDGFVRKFKSDSEMTTRGYILLIAEAESEYAEDIEVPKALGDVFESVAGAIYLDSGMSLDTVWRVYFQMMRPEIDYFSCHVPKSPIRELLESMPQNVRFSPSDLAPDRKHRVIAEVFGLGRFIGVGRNKHSAKCTAAKRALRALKLRRTSATSQTDSVIRNKE